MLTLWAWIAATAYASTPEVRTDLERFRPVADTYGYGITKSAATLRAGRLGLGAWGHYDLGTSLAPTHSRASTLSERAVLDLQAAVGLHDRVSLALDLPVLLWQAAEAGGHGDLAGLQAEGLGDLRVEPHVVLIDPDAGAPVGLALTTALTLPTGSYGTLASDGHLTVTPTVVLESADGSVRDGDYRVRAAFNVGARIKGTDRYFGATYGPELLLRAAGAARIDAHVEIGADVAGVVAAGRDPVEVLPWVALSPTREVRVTLGAGLGVNGGVGSPDARLFAGATLRPGAGPPPPVPVPEPLPEPPPAPEPVPEPEPEPEPEHDTDGDGLLDAVDACPFDAEDFDGFEDDDGCPDPDNDGDGILDIADACPDEPETLNGYLDEDGCPDEVPSRVVVTRTALEIEERIFFELGRAAIQPQSFEVLEELATVILDHPHILRIAVEGHTDDVGSDTVNQRLSQQRAEAVRDFLLEQGVDASRLEAVGYGESRPIDTNRTERGRARNRRVEFTIVEQETR